MGYLLGYNAPETLREFRKTDMRSDGIFIE